MLTQRGANQRPGDLFDVLCRHVVSVSWLDARRQPDGPSDDAGSYDLRAFSASAFVVSVRGIWFLFTAGHILHDLDERLKAGRRIIKSRLTEGVPGRQSFPAIPFVLGDTPQWYVDDDDGLDYAVIPLRPTFALQLRAGGVCALAEAAWTDPPDAPDGYFLLGFPSQGAEITIASDGRKGRVDLSLGVPLLPIYPVDDPPEVLERRSERFYARVPIGTGELRGRAITLTDIDGMSGGPIFAVQNTSRSKCRYWLVAVQSGWARQSRVLAACPIQPLARAIAKCIDAHHDALDGHQIQDDAPGCIARPRKSRGGNRYRFSNKTKRDRR